jgi:uncharacterized protein (DUF1684 family)
MALSQEYVEAWQKWHDARVRDLKRPHGLLSVVSQDWLTEGELFTSEFVPGQWLLDKGEIYYHPDPAQSAKGEFLTVDGRHATGPTHIPHGYNKNSGTGSSVPVFFNDLEVETITRINVRDEVIYAVRVRDPKEAARKQFDDIETFPLDERWIVPAKFKPATITLSNVPTVESGIYEASFTVGELEIVVDGQTFHLEVSGHRAGSAETGYFRDLNYVHIGDLTSRQETYGGGRLVGFDSDEALDKITEIDFNRAVSFPCAFSTFIACPSTPPSNRLPFRLTAGEFKPPLKHERIQTYKG